MTQQQMDFLLNKMIEAAKAVQGDMNCPEDYAGMECHNFTSKESVELATEEFNQLSS